MRLQQLFPRIVAADYEQPKRVSEDCRHLLKRMLTPDPNKRVTIPEIMQHPWCGFVLCVSSFCTVWWLLMSRGLCHAKSQEQDPAYCNRWKVCPGLCSALLLASYAGLIWVKTTQLRLDACWLCKRFQQSALTSNACAGFC